MLLKNLDNLIRELYGLIKTTLFVLKVAFTTSALPRFYLSLYVILIIYNYSGGYINE